MEPVNSIRRLGFRKWYTRQLIDCHLSLVTCFLCGIVLAACVEVLGSREFGMGSASLLGAFVAAMALGWYSWRRYITVLERAERYGERSNCPACRVYGVFEVLNAGIDTIPGPTATAVAPLEVTWMRVKCRKCGAAWRMPE
jgi:formate dehydrogenase maturation protein FdhE